MVHNKYKIYCKIERKKQYHYNMGQNETLTDTLNVTNSDRRYKLRNNLLLRLLTNGKKYHHYASLTIPMIMINE